MSVTVSLFIIDPALGSVDEDSFDAHDDLARLLGPTREAGLAIQSYGETIVRDGIDDVLLGMCVAVPQMLDAGKGYVNVSYAGYSSAVISLDGTTVKIDCDGEIVTADKDELIAALRAAARRYGERLRDQFPDDAGRWQELLDNGA